MVEDGYKRIINEQLAGTEALDAMYEQGRKDREEQIKTLAELFKISYASLIEDDALAEPWFLGKIDAMDELLKKISE